MKTQCQQIAVGEGARMEARRLSTITEMDSEMHEVTFAPASARNVASGGGGGMWRLLCGICRGDKEEAVGTVELPSPITYHQATETPPPVPPRPILKKREQSPQQAGGPRPVLRNQSPRPFVRIREELSGPGHGLRVDSPRPALKIRHLPHQPLPRTIQGSMTSYIRRLNLSEERRPPLTSEELEEINRKWREAMKALKK